MKRIIIVSCLLAGMIAVSIFSLYRVSQVRDEMNRHIDNILEASRDGDPERLDAYLQELTVFWHREERRLIHFVRHSHIDEITRGVAKLPSLAAFENYAELSAELFSIKWQMDSIWYSELPTWDNIL